jgi:hypothetical protein
MLNCHEGKRLLKHVSIFEALWLVWFEFYHAIQNLQVMIIACFLGEIKHVMILKNVKSVPFSGQCSTLGPSRFPASYKPCTSIHVSRNDPTKISLQ